MRQEYNKDYRTREYDRFSDLEPQRERKKPSFLTLLLVGLLVLLVCSLGYDNIIKPYLEKSKEQTEEPVATSTQEVEEPASSEMVETTAMDKDATVPEVRKEPVQKSQPISPEQVSVTGCTCNSCFTAHSKTNGKAYGEGRFCSFVWTKAWKCNKHSIVF